jgi:hypothetical protein
MSILSNFYKRKNYCHHSNILLNFNNIIFLLSMVLFFNIAKYCNGYSYYLKRHGYSYSTTGTNSHNGRLLPRLLFVNTQIRKRQITSISSTTMNTNEYNPNTNQKPKVIISLSESYWRTQAQQHSFKIKSLLKSGLLPLPLQQSKRKSKRHTTGSSGSSGNNNSISWTALDPKHPIFNFLIEYYGLKGLKGPKRLARWSPDPTLLLLSKDKDEGINDGSENDNEYMKIHHLDSDSGSSTTTTTTTTTAAATSNQLLSDIITASNGYGGIFLENANVNDFNDGILHLRGAIPIPMSLSSNSTINSESVAEPEFHGILYNPYLFYNQPELKSSTPPSTSTTTSTEPNPLLKTIAPFQWYKSILQTTLSSDPIFHCHGLHEWAMVYHPPSATTPPPSTQYQSHLKFRISQQIINDTIESRGIHCTHVDALRFFAKDAGKFNHHGSSLQRMDQLILEQKGCVHAHMDLLKIGLKLQPFIDCNLIGDILNVAIMARKLDVEASPYDVSEYGCEAVEVETEEGRRIYRMRQKELMEMAEPVRERLVHAYNVFLNLAFEEEFIRATETPRLSNNTNNKSESSYHDLEGGKGELTDTKVRMSNNSKGDEKPYFAAPERFAKCEPGGKPWRQNLIESNLER